MKKYMVMGAEPEASEDADESPESEQEDDAADAFDDDARFQDAKRKLRLVLCRADFRSLPWIHGEDGRRRER